MADAQSPSLVEQAKYIPPHRRAIEDQPKGLGESPYVPPIYYGQRNKHRPKHSPRHIRRSRHNRKLKSSSSPEVIEFPDLPWDIISIILSKCPVTSIVRFRCVSKSFDRLPIDPSFIASQLKGHPPFYLLSGFRFMDSLYLVDLDSWKYKWKTTRIRMMDELWGSKLAIVGSCNGLLCLLKQNTSNVALIMYNPITRESMTLPTIDRDIVVGYEPFKGSISFGFDVSCQKYKVMMIYPSETSVEVYVINLGDTSWRKIDIPTKFEVVAYFGKTSIFLNGCFYWIISKESDFAKRILAMDICEEKFREIDFIDPSSEDDFMNLSKLGNMDHVDYDNEYYLINFRNSLAVVVYGPQDGEMQIYLLVDHERGLWKLHSTHNLISDLTNRIIRHEVCRCRVEGVIGDDCLLLNYYEDNLSDFRNLFGPSGSHLVSYNMENREFRPHLLHNRKTIPDFFDVVSFVPSFVSFKDIKENKR